MFAPAGFRCAEAGEKYELGDLFLIDSGGALPGSRAFVLVVAIDPEAWGFFSSHEGHLPKCAGPDAMLSRGMRVWRPDT